MKATELFKGIVILIDDEVNVETANVQKLVQQIKKYHYPLVKYEQIPRPEEVANFGNIAFLVLDWELSTDIEVLSGVQLPQSAKNARIQDNVSFIKKIQADFFMPIFIFTNANIEEVKETLRSNGISVESHGGTIFIRSKTKVSTGLMTEIKNWLKKSPSMYSLKAWDMSYVQAKTKLFQDLYALNPKWPKVMWSTYKEDSVPPSNELGKLITSNLLARMQPFEFQSSILDGRHTKVTRADLIKVLESERFLSQTNLNTTLAAPGDVFKYKGDVYINIKSECDCVSRNGEDIELYLLKGSKLNKYKTRFNLDFGKFDERDNEFIIYPILDGKCYSFNFKRIYMVRWSEIQGARIGRVISPYITKLQQKYSAYLQRQGLQRLPKKAI